MKPKILILFLLVLAGLYVYIAATKAPGKKAQATSEPNKIKAEHIGERITYRVKLGRINLGSAVFRRLPDTQLNGKNVGLSTFETKMGGFRDLETIYSDLDNLLPLKVERTISTWFSPEKISEDYDQNNFTLTIKKLKSARTQETVIKKDSAINNAVLLPFYVRDVANLDVGYSLRAVLPTREFLIELTEKAEVEVPAGRFMAYHFKSKPEKFEIWISADGQRIPVKIKGSNGPGYILSMEKYSTN